MSFVEKALKKFQDAKDGAAVPPVLPSVVPHVVVGKLIESPPIAPVAIAVAPVVPRKTIHVDLNLLRSIGLLPPEYQERELAAQYRHIKRPLIASAKGKGVPAIRNGQLIMVASAFPGEGKTFTSINLAMSMALEKDTSVVLLDADVAKAHLSRLFGVDKEPGLLDALRDDSLDIESLVLPTDVPGLSVLPAGLDAEQATELLASEQMQSLMDRIIKQNPNRIVLFDSPPLLLTSESRVLAQIAGQVALVVCANRTLQKAVQEAIASIGPDKSIGLILNQSTRKSQNGYYYGHGDYGSQSDSRS